nr:uncharacterized protein LOC109169324 [Ipomoea batatas]
MAPKTRNPKRNRGESSRQPQEQPQGAQAEIFNTPGALERFQTWISTRDFKKERGLEYVVPERWNWGPLLLAQPGVAFAAVVREFYANAKDGPRNNNGMSKQYIQSRYGHGQMPVNDPDDEENEEQAHDEAMEDPAPAAHAPNQFPPQYNMEQYFARQEEFMRRQEEFMTRHEARVT